MKSRHTTKDIEEFKHDGTVLPSSEKCAVARRRVIKPVIKADDKERKDSLPKERADKVTVESLALWNGGVKKVRIVEAA